MIRQMHRNDDQTSIAEALGTIHTQAGDFWFARLSVLLIAALQLLMINNLTIGPKWLAPGLELALLAPLSVATAWTQVMARDAQTDRHWLEIERARRWIRAAALGLTALITAMNFGAVAELVRLMLVGQSHRAGETLLLDALNIWMTNVIVFALWFWSTDHGGPAARGLSRSNESDFLFPQMKLDPPHCPSDWSPSFFDYVYLAFTNATAFSPTDTLPLSTRAKLLMMFEAAISLLTIAIIASRAINKLT
jgi:hypothetical protein